MIALPAARLPRIRNGSLLLITTSNFQSRSGGSGNDRPARSEGGSGCGAGRPGKLDRDDVDILEEAAVCRQHLTADGRAVERTLDLDVGIDPRGQVVVPSDEHAVRFQLEIEVRFGQFWERDASGTSERPAGEIAAETIEAQVFSRKFSCALKFVRAGRSRSQIGPHRCPGRPSRSRPAGRSCRRHRH